MTDHEESETPERGWYESGRSLRYWDGTQWRDEIRPPLNRSLEAKTIVWALALAFGVAGALGWGVPVIAFYWPLGLGGAGVALSVAAWQMEGPTPSWAVIAVLASLAALFMGFAGYQELEDTRGLFE